MKSKISVAIEYGVTSILITLVVFAAMVTAQETPPIIPDGNKIEGAWNSQLTYKSCSTGATLFTGQSMVAYSQGGILTAITSGAAPALRSIGLGVWRHVGGREYVATFKEFRYDASGALTGKVIVVSQIRHELDDTLTTSAVGTFYNAAGNPTSSVCP